VIGLAGPYGSGCSSFAEELETLINGWPNCKVRRIRLSEAIKAVTPSFQEKSAWRPHERRQELQNLGTLLRQKRPTIIGELAAAIIFVTATADERNEKPSLGTENGTTRNSPAIRVFIVDSLKNGNDVNSLRRTYQGEFCLVYVSSSRECRWRRLRDYKNWKDSERTAFDELDLVDSDEELQKPFVGKAGQQVRKLAAMSDYFVVNDKGRDVLRTEAEVLFERMIGGRFNQPRRAESAMHLAYSASLRSFCLSRQVGAAIVADDGELISLGHNDVPSGGGSLYSLDHSDDRRCYAVGDRRCINDVNKEERFERLGVELTKVLGLTAAAQRQLYESLRASDFRDAIEYCRAVHAEMEALMSAGRRTSGVPKGSTMYVTTEPCHNCMKHILASGVTRVVFIEPYPKSLAQELHSDALASECGGREGKVRLEMYSGVAPGRYSDFFGMNGVERKVNGRSLLSRARPERVLVPRFAHQLMPRVRSEMGDLRKAHPFSFSELEAVAMVNSITGVTVGPQP
jgi:deoxycytidylate deaminase